MSTFNTQELDFGAAIVTSTSDISYTHVDVPPVTPLNTDPNVLRDYVVIVKQGLTIADLEKDLERDTTLDDSVDSSIIPDRIVNVADRRPASDIQTQYWLTDIEAEKLRNHPDVLDVELNPAVNPAIRLVPHAIQAGAGNFTKQALFGTAPGSNVNWGLARCSANTNIYGTGTSTSVNYEYIADGTGVDVVIMDTGILVNHPEFLYANGTSRVQQIDWYAVTGTSGTMPTNFYTDDIGHGTSVASVVAGKTMGWAKNAKIYVMNILGTAGTTIGSATGFDLINKFHVQKPIDPVLGTKRPTVVNGSWGATGYVMNSGSPYNPYSGHTIYTGYQIWGGSYRSTAWSGYVIHPEYALDGTQAGTYTNSSGNNSILYQINGYSTTDDTALASMIANGVHYIKSAGNDHTKQDISTGVDYNNYVSIISSINASGQPVLSNIYYNRPCSPWANGCISVGASNTSVYSSTLDQRGTFSSYGTAVDLYAPGVGIVCAGVASNVYGGAYAGNSSYWQINESGTSFSAPEVAGVLSLFLQQNPSATVANAKKWVTANNQGCIRGVLYDDSLSNTYASGTISLSAGNNAFLYNPFSSANMALGSNGLAMLNGIVTFQTS
jgi:subtilisin family serine protease